MGVGLAVQGVESDAGSAYAARGYGPGPKAVLIDVRGPSFAAAWLMVRMLAWSARLQSPILAQGLVSRLPGLRTHHAQGGG